MEVEAEGGATGVGKQKRGWGSFSTKEDHIELCRGVYWWRACLLYCGTPSEQVCGGSRPSQCGVDVGPDVPCYYQLWTQRPPFVSCLMSNLIMFALLH